MFGLDLYFVCNSANFSREFFAAIFIYRLTICCSATPTLLQNFLEMSAQILKWYVHRQLRRSWPRVAVRQADRVGIGAGYCWAATVLSRSSPLVRWVAMIQAGRTGIGDASGDYRTFLAISHGQQIFPANRERKGLMSSSWQCQPQISTRHLKYQHSLHGIHKETAL